jgi:hypothetical protein
MLRSFSRKSSAAPCGCWVVASGALFNSVRTQGWGGVPNNNHLHHPEIKQHDGVDDIIRVKAEQQKWLNHEQYAGYSDSYLQREMQFTPQYEQMAWMTSTTLNKYLVEIGDIVYTHYGAAADALEEAEANPLHPNFNALVETARAGRGKLEAELDRLYGQAHPTVKTLYDAMLVRRWQTLEDWIELVQRKRAQTLDRLSPEWIEELEKQRGVAAEYKARLRHIGTAMEANPVAFLEATGQFTEKELVMIERRKRFFKKAAEFGTSITSRDMNPH